MINHTNSYLRFRRQAEEMWDFVVTVCFAVPSLKEQIRLVRTGVVGISLPPPDYFKGQSIQQIRVADYKSKLSRYIVLSSFSFFEAYIIDAIREMIEFHGGTEEFINRAQQKIEESIGSIDGSTQEHKRKLQEPEKPGKELKYLKHSKHLVEAGYKFPSELLSSYGIRSLAERLDNLRSADIPILLSQGLNCEINAERFHQIRDIRNKLAHGRANEVRLTLKKAIKLNDDLRKFAVKIDKHLTQHFFVLEKYA